MNFTVSCWPFVFKYYYVRFSETWVIEVLRNVTISECHLIPENNNLLTQFLARSAKLPTGPYILPSVISSLFFSLLGAKLSQYLLDWFSRSFHQTEGICVNFLDQVHFFQFLKVHVHVVVRRILSNISGYTGPIFAIFSPYESAIHADDETVRYFPICQGTLP